MNRNSIQLYQFSAARLTINIAIALRLSRSQKNLKKKEKLFTFSDRDLASRVWSLRNGTFIPIRNKI